MKKSAVLRFIPYLFCLLILFVLAGCNKQSQYRTLTFFFTGVPPYEEWVKEENVSATEQSDEEKEVVGKSYASTHKPWQDGACGRCHQLKTEEITSASDAPEDQNDDFTAHVSAELTLPKEELCLQCHGDKTPRQAIKKRLWLHTAVAEGKCLACHVPHHSEYPDLLRTSVEEVCSTCHSDKSALPKACSQEPSGPGTRNVEGCFACHNAHLGVNSNLLFREYDEEGEETFSPGL